MPDDRKPGASGRARDLDEQYEVVHFATKYGLSIFEARRILREAGESRQKADAAALAMKAGKRDARR